MKNSYGLDVYERYNRIKYSIRLPWGKIIKIHTIGDIRILEYFNHEENTTGFHVSVNNHDTHGCYSTLEEAIVNGIAHKYDGFNTRAASYFFKMIGNEIHEDFKKTNCACCGDELPENSENDICNYCKELKEPEPTGKYVEVEYYAEYDEDYGGWCVFDTETGKAHSSYCDRQEAEKDAEERNQGSKLIYVTY